MKKYFYFFLLTLTACNTPKDPLLSMHPFDSDTSEFKNETTNTKNNNEFTVDTHLQDTTKISGNFILFLRPDSLRFESYLAQTEIKEADADFGYGIQGTMDSIVNNSKYRNIFAFVSTDRFILIQDCKSCPLLIDRDSINYGYILSGKKLELKTNYSQVHSGNYLQEINEYFKIK